MPEMMRIIRPTNPDFKELLESGRLVSGADLNALWHAWNAGEIPAPDDGKEVVQPKNQSDLSEDETKQRVEQEIAENGLPSDADLMKDDRMNDTTSK